MVVSNSTSTKGGKFNQSPIWKLDLGEFWSLGCLEDETLALLNLKPWRTRNFEWKFVPEAQMLWRARNFQSKVVPEARIFIESSGAIFLCCRPPSTFNKRVSNSGMPTALFKLIAAGVCVAWNRSHDLFDLSWSIWLNLSCEIYLRLWLNLRPHRMLNIFTVWN